MELAHLDRQNDLLSGKLQYTEWLDSLVCLQQMFFDTLLVL